jgi:hypothetical protein
MRKINRKYGSNSGNMSHYVDYDLIPTNPVISAQETDSGGGGASHKGDGWATRQ